MTDAEILKTNSGIDGKRLGFILPTLKAKAAKVNKSVKGKGSLIRAQKVVFISLEPTPSWPAKHFSEGFRTGPD